MNAQNKNIRAYHPKWSDDGKECNFIPNEMKKLIIGTMPPENLCINEEGRKINPKHHNNSVNKKGKKNKNIDFFYGSTRNKLWRLLSNISKNKNIIYNKDDDNKKDNYEEYLVDIRKEFVKEYHIGFADVIESCIHNESSSKDSELLSIEPNKTLIEILKKYPEVEIFCTSKNTLWFLKIYFVENITESETDGYDVKFKDIENHFKVYTMLSASGRAIKNNKYNNKLKKLLIDNK